MEENREQVMRGRRGDDTGNVGRFFERSFVLLMSQSIANNMLPKPINLELSRNTQRCYTSA